MTLRGLRHLLRHHMELRGRCFEKKFTYILTTFKSLFVAEEQLQLLLLREQQQQNNAKHLRRKKNEHCYVIVAIVTNILQTHY